MQYSVKTKSLNYFDLLLSQETSLIARAGQNTNKSITIKLIRKERNAPFVILIKKRQIMLCLK